MHITDIRKAEMLFEKNKSVNRLYFAGDRFWFDLTKAKSAGAVRYINRANFETKNNK